MPPPDCPARPLAGRVPQRSRDPGRRASPGSGDAGAPTARCDGLEPRRIGPVRRTLGEVQRADGGVGGRRADRRRGRIRGSCLAGEDAQSGQEAGRDGGADDRVSGGHRGQRGWQGRRRGGVAWRPRRSGRDGHGRLGNGRDFQGGRATHGRRRPRQHPDESPRVRSGPGGHTVQDACTSGPSPCGWSHLEAVAEDQPPVEDAPGLKQGAVEVRLRCGEVRPVAERAAWTSSRSTPT
jgi:hypothetical protein